MPRDKAYLKMNNCILKEKYINVCTHAHKKIMYMINGKKKEKTENKQFMQSFD